MRTIDHFIAGGSGPASTRFHDVFDPNQGSVQARVGLGTAADLERAMVKAREVQPAWAATNPQRRARVMFAFKALVEANMDALAHSLSSEHGKVIADSRGDVQLGLEVIEYACSIPQALKGEYTQGAGPGIDVYSMRQPLGICVGITPFNFPAMIPMWMFGVAIACGNAFILKPSERDPTVPVRLAELMKEAGLPDGILNVVHGDKEMVDAILDHPEIKAISFVGSSDIAQYIYSRGTATGKRVQAFGGAMTYARRYALSAMVGMVSELDDDGHSAGFRDQTRGAFQQQPGRTAPNRDGYGDRREPTREGPPAGNGGRVTLGDGRPPAHGKALYVIVKKYEEQIGEPGLLKFLNDFGKASGFPYKMTEWDAGQAHAAYQEGLAAIRRMDGDGEPAAAGANGSDNDPADESDIPF